MGTHRCPNCNSTDTVAGIDRYNCQSCGQTFPWEVPPTFAPDGQPGTDPPVVGPSAGPDVLGDEDNRDLRRRTGRIPSRPYAGEDTRKQVSKTISETPGQINPALAKRTSAIKPTMAPTSPQAPEGRHDVGEHTAEQGASEEALAKADDLPREDRAGIGDPDADAHTVARTEGNDISGDARSRNPGSNTGVTGAARSGGTAAASVERGTPKKRTARKTAAKKTAEKTATTEKAADAETPAGSEDSGDGD